MIVQENFIYMDLSWSSVKFEHDKIYNLADVIFLIKFFYTSKIYLQEVITHSKNNFLLH